MECPVNLRKYCKEQRVYSHCGNDHSVKECSTKKNTSTRCSGPHLAMTWEGQNPQTENHRKFNPEFSYTKASSAGTFPLLSHASTSSVDSTSSRGNKACSCKNKCLECSKHSLTSNFKMLWLLSMTTLFLIAFTFLLWWPHTLHQPDRLSWLSIRWQSESLSQILTGGDPNPIRKWYNSSKT